MRKIQILTFIFLFLFLNSVWPESLNEFRGKAFSDPSYRVNMPEEWKKKKIKYESWAEGADLSVSINQHLYLAVLPIINKYAKENDLSIAITKKSICGITTGRFASKSIDIGTFCCPLGLRDRLPGLRFYTVGIAPIGFLVNFSNPIDNITFEEAQQVYLGEIRLWSEMKGANVLIHPVIRLHCKMRPGGWKVLLANEEFFSPQLSEVSTINDVIVSVANNRDAIGFESLWQINNHERSQDVKVIRINGYDPAKPSVLLSGRYPFYQTHNIAIWEGQGLENPHARKLVEYIMKEIETVKSTFYLVTAPDLRKAGWKFKGYELIGENEK